MTKHVDLPEEWWSAELEAAADKFWKEALALVEKIEGGEISEQEGRKLIADMLGGDDREAGNFLLHTLHQAELDEYQRRTGTIVD